MKNLSKSRRERWRSPPFIPAALNIAWQARFARSAVAALF